MDWTLLLLAALLLGGKKAAPNGRSSEEEAAADGAALVRRAANGSRWASLFRAAGVDERTAEALARWAGIESSGNPLAVSRLGERGLLQSMESTALRGRIYSAGEWFALSDPATSETTHAELAIKLFRAMWSKARSRVKEPPTDPIDQVFYAKLWHQWPKDFTTEKMHGPALPMAAELARRWANKPKSTHRLRAAAVVAFGVPEPWRTGNA